MQAIQHFRSQRRLIAASVALALAACASAPVSNSRLDQAHAAYRQTSADPDVARAAQRELQQANDALGKADAALKAGEPADQVDHLAYLAQQRVAVADATGRIAKEDRSVAEAKSQREQIVLQARTREAQSAQQLAQQGQEAAQDARQQASASQERARMLEQQLEALKARPTDRGMVLTLGDVLFDTGAATLKPGAMRTVDQLADFLRQHAGEKVLVEGYTDSVGSESMNLELSRRRADAVKAAIAERGVPSDRVETRGLGEAYAVASNNTAGGRQLNRRVEIVFSDDRGQFKTSNQ